MTNNNCNNGSKGGVASSCDCGDSVPLPPGYAFQPTDAELLYYLNKKNNGDPFEGLIKRLIPELDVYNELTSPEDLLEGWELDDGQKGWFFFIPFGKSPNRITSEGPWRDTGVEEEVIEKYSNHIVIGLKRTLVFHVGLERVETSWFMHEYRCTKIPTRQRTNSCDIKMDDWVVCMIYKNEATNNAEEDPNPY